MFQTCTYFLTCWVNGIDTERRISSDLKAVPACTLSKNSGVILMDRFVPDGCRRQHAFERGVLIERKKYLLLVLDKLVHHEKKD